MKTQIVVNFIISDTASKYIPENKCNGGSRPNLGTQFVHKCNSIKEAVKIANKVIHLTTGLRENVFDYSKVLKQVRSGCPRLAWSNDNKTHHCELLVDGEWTHYTTAIHK